MSALYIKEQGAYLEKRAAFVSVSVLSEYG